MQIRKNPGQSWPIVAKIVVAQASRLFVSDKPGFGWPTGSLQARSARSANPKIKVNQAYSR